jgi:hypothetical protein
VSGNLAFLNWLTLIPIVACFDDDALRWVLPRRVRAWIDRRVETANRTGGSEALRGSRIAAGILAGVVALASLDVIANLLSSDQAMNRTYDRLALVNTYGAFGSVTMVRHELIIEGTRDENPNDAHWIAYELPCKPGALERRPCILGPYHRRLDWLIWFAAMRPKPGGAPWVIHYVWKLLHADRGARSLLAIDPFGDQPPRWIRIRRFVYRFAPADDAAWWVRDQEELWLPPIGIETPGLREWLAQFGWPSPIDAP